MKPGGQVHRGKKVNFIGFKSFATQVWDFQKYLVVTEHGQNLFQFNFELEADLNKVLNNRPWAMNNQLLVLRKWEPNIELKDTAFKTSHFGSKFGTYLYTGLQKREVTNGFKRTITRSKQGKESSTKEHGENPEVNGLLRSMVEARNQGNDEIKNKENEDLLLRNGKAKTRVGITSKVDSLAGKRYLNQREHGSRMDMGINE
ncbi:hypothetical protein ACH5RR_039128 [Cinchona calisaya]|uniref:DUF4283 domain-containing protein n=1 Tax=Cinchona calisaya TaxID=153742 RepID=A0ABD2Y2M7_9GENT